MSKTNDASQYRELTDSELELVSGGTDWSFAARVACDVYTAAVGAFTQILSDQALALAKVAQT